VDQRTGLDAFGRRTLLTTTVAGAVVTFLSGCGSASVAPSAAGGAGTTGGAAGGSGSSGTTTSSAPPATAATQLPAATKDALTAAITGKEVAVGKAKIYPDAGIIVSQPKADSFLVFPNVCTHEKSLITTINAEGHLVCPRHGSEFDAATGSVVKGPALKSLQSQTAKISGDTFTLS